MLTKVLARTVVTDAVYASLGNAFSQSCAPPGIPSGGACVRGQAPVTTQSATTQVPQAPPPSAPGGTVAPGGGFSSGYSTLVTTTVTDACGNVLSTGGYIA